jgi:hypothetical protein
MKPTRGGQNKRPKKNFGQKNRMNLSRNHFAIEWKDSGKEPKCAPDPAYPNGIDLDVSNGSLTACTLPLDYPAKRIGCYYIECKLCGIRVACTTAGRVDDPKSIKIACITQ